MITLLAVVALAAVAGARPGPASADPPDPQQLPATGIPWRDQIYYGATPSESEALPVLVFVHGFGGLAQDWWEFTKFHGMNDMYVTAYEAGYRTAFVTLNWDGARWPVESMWINGLTLGRQIGAIAEHYGVDKVDIIAHSKGGVDAQAAAAYFGAAQRVRNVFTLGTPHWGTEIADLGFDTVVGRLLLKLLDMDDAGIQFMTTTYMGLFRALTDVRTADDGVRYYWAGGTGWQTGPLGLRLSGRYLSKNFGPNDGLVTVASAQLPGDNSFQLFVEPFNHFNIISGSNAFPYIDAIARQPTAAGATLEPR